ncbi:MAG: DUF5671 domain-containing protein [Anaerolineae bacterium]|nr:DUF5671 domain-containing protein [Anaerolineae bacterium]
MINFYLYSVTSISLLLFYTATLTFTKGAFYVVLGADDGNDGLQAIASGLGYAAVAFPLWWLHWSWLRKQFDAAKGDQNLWHQFYLFSVVCLNILVMLFAGGVGVASMLEYLLGAGDLAPRAVARTGVLVATLLLSFTLWRHHWQQFTQRFGQGLPFITPSPEIREESSA